MPTQEFNCPNCGAPVDYHGEDVSTIRCPFCSTSVVVPAELRPKPKPSVRATPAAPQPASASSKKGTILLALIAVVFVAILWGVVSLTEQIGSQARKAVSNSVDPLVEMATRLPGMILTMVVTGTPDVPTLTPTSSLFQRQVSFGSKGIGPGMLNDPRYIAVDGSGTVYVADYQGGRIQAFDPSGKLLHLWQVGSSKTIIDGMAANHQGVVWVAYDGEIYRYDGASGELLGKVSYSQGPEFGDLAASPDGGLVGVWYEGRWGLITSLEGHRDDLVWFDANGNTLHTLSGFISGQTGDLALDTLVAVDGLGTIYAASSGEIFKFTSGGKFVTRFPIQGDSSGSSYSVDAIAIDGQGRIFTASRGQISVFAPDGRFLKSFEVDISADRLAFDESGALYVLASDRIARYSLSGLP
jgi:outer membrane protein assembly factor BamB